MPDEVALLAEFFDADDDSRRDAIEQLTQRLNHQPSAFGQILCHRPSGLYVLLPVMLAKRLLTALLMVREAQATA